MPGGRLSLDASAWLDALTRHAEALHRRFGASATAGAWATSYVGGGTPSALPPAALAAALAIASPLAGGEFSIEANPEDLSVEFLSVALDSALTRMSLGVQSLEAQVRATISRRGAPEAVRRSLERFAAAWPRRWSADFIYGLPSQSPEGLARDLRFAVELGAGHISLYELGLSEGAPLARAVASGEAELPDASRIAELYRAAADTLRAAGFRRYELSNWAVPGQECWHNLRYWSMAGWLALGPSASATLRSEGRFLRIENAAELSAYAADPVGSSREEFIEGFDARFEYAMMALRRADGVDLEDYGRFFGDRFEDCFGSALSAFPGFGRFEGGRWIPSEAGLDGLKELLLACLDGREAFELRRGAMPPMEG